MKRIVMDRDDVDDLEAWLEDEDAVDPGRLGKLLSNRRVRGEYDD